MCVFVSNILVYSTMRPIFAPALHTHTHTHTQSSGEEEDHSSDGNNLSDSPPHSPTPHIHPPTSHTPPSSSSFLPPATNGHSSQHTDSSMCRNDVWGEHPLPPDRLLCGRLSGRGSVEDVPTLPPHPLVLMFAERQAEEGLFTLAMYRVQ